LSDRPLQPIRNRKSPITRDPAKNKLGHGFPSTSVPVSKYSMTVNNVVKNAHGASVSRIYGTQRERLVEGCSFLPPNVVATRETALDGIKGVVGRRNS